MDQAAALDVLKAMAEPTRMKIIDILSCGELCACKILDGLSISQSTLSHHMKVLMDCRLVTGRKEATWMHYTLNAEAVEQFVGFMTVLTHPKDDCICKTADGPCCPTAAQGREESR